MTIYLGKAARNRPSCTAVVYITESSALSAYSVNDRMDEVTQSCTRLCTSAMRNRSDSYYNDVPDSAQNGFGGGAANASNKFDFTVVYVDPTSQAHKSGVVRGDVLVQINDKRTSTL